MHPAPDGDTLRHGSGISELGTTDEVREGRKEGRNFLFDINNHNTEYTTVKLCRETPTKAQSVPLSREPPTCHNT